MLRSKRYCDSECAALTYDAFHTHSSAVESGKFLHERQSYTSAFVCARPAVLATIKTLEDVGKFSGRNANARIAYCEDGLPLLCFQPHFDLSLKCELESVAQE